MVKPAGFIKRANDGCIERAVTFLLAASLCTAISLSDAWAQSGYPVKALRLVVPYPPGASTDMFGRIVAQKLAESFGQAVVVENRGGANGAIGAENVAKAVPDGYSLLLNTSSYTTNAAMQRKLPFDPINDLAAVGMIAKGPLVIVVNPSVPAHNVSELIGIARAKPDALSYCSAGNGSIQQFATEMFLNATKTIMVHVPYKGMAPAVTDLIGGHVQVLFGSIPTAISQVKAQRLRALAVTSQERTSFAPEIPTVRESGVPGYSVELWWGLFVTGKAPAESVARLNAELRKALLVSEFREKIAGEGAEPAATTPAEFQKIVIDDIVKWRSVAQTRGIKSE